MKRKFLFLTFIILSITVFAQNRHFDYSPSFRYSPDRDGDIAWENDRVAFRIYGKKSSQDKGLSGVDCWHKKVNYPILDKWYNHQFNGKNYHTDYGEGCDQYHVSSSRGCGGIGIWKDNELFTSGSYDSWEVISITQTTLQFKLTYCHTINSTEITETRIITLENGSQLYQAESQFLSNSKPIVGFEIAVGLSTDEQANAKVTFNSKEGWLSVWHDLGDNKGKIGTGAIVDTKYLVKMFEDKPEVGSSNALAIVKTDSNGKIKYSAGFAWKEAQYITSEKEWNSYLSNF